jgi:hypothetical protein
MPQSAPLTLEYNQPFGLSGVAEVAKVTTDTLGNVYTIGSFRGAVDLDPSNESQIFSSNGSAFIRKQDNNGKFIWATQFAPASFANTFGADSSNSFNKIDIDVDSAGNIYAIGYFGLSKWDSSGNSIWLSKIEDLGIIPYGIQRPKISVDDLGNIYAITPTLGLTKFKSNGEVEDRLDRDNIKTNDVSISESGDVYTIGTFSGIVDFEPGNAVRNLDSSNGSTFIRKVNRDQELVWIKQLPLGASSNYINYDHLTFTVNNTGIAINGFFDGTVDFDPGTSSKILQSNDGRSIFTGKFDLDGNFLWANKIEQGSQYYLSVYTKNQIGMDSNGNVYVAGGFVSTIDFDPGSGISTLTPLRIDPSAHNTFVSKLDRDGNFVWVKQFGSNYHSVPTGMTVDRQGNIITAGKFDVDIDVDPSNGSKVLRAYQYSDGFLSKLNNSGDFVWGQQFGSGFNYSERLPTDNRGNLYYGGALIGAVDFTISQQRVQISSSGSTDAIIGRINTSGQIDWIRSFGGLGFDAITEIKVDSNGIISAIGVFRGTVDFDPGSSIFNLTSRFTGNQSDGFIVKFDANGNFIEAQLQDYVPPVEQTEFSDRLGNRYVISGRARNDNLAITKYDRNNQVIWSEKFSPLTYALDIDKDGNIYSFGLESLEDFRTVLRKYSQSKPKAEIFWQNQRNGYSGFWQMNNATELVGATMLTYGSNFEPNLAGQLVYRAPDWKLVGTADFNQDGVTDHIYQNGQFISIWSLGADANGQTAYLLNAAPPTLFGQPIDRVASNWVIVGIADMNKDGYKDLIFQNTVSDYVGIWYMKANNQVLGQAVVTNAASSGFTPGAAARTHSSTWRIIGVADFDGDGEMELMFRSAIWNAVSIWKLKDGQFLGAVSLPNLASGFEASGIGDFNGDGIADVVWHDRSSGTTHIWTMNRQTVATQTTLVNGGGSNGWEIAAIADMNFDGIDDLIWRNSLTDQSAVWLIKNAQPTIGSNFIRRLRPNGNLDIQLTGDLAWNIEAANDFS